LLQKNGQLSTANGLAEEEEVSPQEGALNGHDEEVTVTDVGQRESEDVSERGSDRDMASGSAVVQDVTKEEQEEMPEVIEQIPSSESHLEELIQPTESQSNDVGFKKVFKFVGFKFTVKKDKTEKSDTVQLLTVKKDEGEGAAASDGAGDHQEPSRETGDATAKESELKQSTEKPEDTLQHEPSNTEVSLPAESGQAAEEGKEAEEKHKEPTKSLDSPTSPVASETASPFKKFFTQGWAGWREKTSFRKPKEEEPEASEKKKDQEPEKADAEEQEKAEETSEKGAAPQPPRPQDTAEGVGDARLSAEYEKVELPSDGQGQEAPEEKPAPLATEVFDDRVETVAEVHVSMTEKKAGEPEAEEEEVEVVEPLPPEPVGETQAEVGTEEPAKTPEVFAPGGDHAPPSDLSPEEKAPPAHPEGPVCEVDVLSSQERLKVQGSPLKKLFTSTGLKKLSGKKQKGKRGGGDEECAEQHHAAPESPDSTDEQKGESSASSPEEPEEITCLEKGVADAQPEPEGEEGAVSDGEKKREGVTPWASFKKMVTPKKRVRRLSESDKEDELEKVKSATLSSTESAASEVQEEAKGNGEEQKPEEPKRRVDTSVSWEALICVGSSKKRARKASSSDDEAGPKTVAGDSQKPDDKDTGPDAALASSQEHDQGPGSSSPEQAGSPSEGEGVSTWESFKRLVTPRKKSKSKLEEKSEDSATGSGIEHSASDVEPGKEESWVSIKKFIPGRRKKRADGKLEQATVEDAGPTEVNEDDSDVPAVVPLSEYDAVEREKIEAQQDQKSEEKPEQKVAVSVSEELSTNLVHAVTVTVVDGARALSNVEERSPSWISASVTGPLEQIEDEAKPLTEEVSEGEVLAEETAVVTKTLPEGPDATDDTVISEVELTSDAVTAAETSEALCAEEAAEASGAEETADMVSAVSQLTDSPVTTEEATPVQEVEGGVPDIEDQERRTQQVLQAVAEKVREESQLPDTRGPEDTMQTMQEVGAKIPEEVEVEEDSQGPDLRKEADVVLKVRVEETETESLTQGEVIVQATPESFEQVPQVTDSVESGESSELRTTCPAETLVEVKSEFILEQAVAPDSAETLTDSETNGSTPVADSEALNITQQEKMTEIHEDPEVASDTQSQVTEAEAVPTSEQMPPAPSSFQSQEEDTGHSKMEEVLEHTDEEISVETVPILSKTEVMEEEGRSTDQETRDKPLVEGPEVSADTETTVSQKETVEVVALEDEVTEDPEFQKNDNIELQSHTPSPPTQVEKELVIEVEKEKMEAEPTQASEEKLEQKPAVTVSEELSKQLVQTVSVAIIDGEKEVTSLEESSPGPAQEDAAYTETQVQSSEPSLTLTAAAVEEKVLEETVKILEAPETLESADVHLIPEEAASEKDEDFTTQPGEDEVPTGTESQPESILEAISATPEGGIVADPEGDKTTPQKWASEKEDEPAGCQEAPGDEPSKEDFKAESEILKLETESSKLVQNVIQTAVDQLVSTEETAADFQTQAQPMKAATQEAPQQIEEEERVLQASTQDETQTTAAEEESTLTAVDQTHADVSKAVSEVPEETPAVEVESSSVGDQHPEEAVLPSEEKKETTGTESIPEGGDHAESGERIEESLSESQEEERDDAVDDPESRPSVLEDSEASGGLTKGCLDTDVPALKEEEGGQELELQEAKALGESEEEIKTQTPEETQKQEEEPAKSEPTGS
ncbi:AKA12 protein, partial [Crocuta crocuta]